MRALLAAILLTTCSGQATQPDPRVTDLAVRLETAERDLATGRTELDWYRQQLAQVQEDARALRERAEKAECCGSFPMWTKPVTIPAGTVHAAGLPDTFTATIRFKADQPVRAWIMTFGEMTKYMSSQAFSPTMSFGRTTEVDVVFHEAEGCAIYALVIEASVETRVTPDVWITRNPTAASGACR